MTEEEVIVTREDITAAWTEFEEVRERQRCALTCGTRAHVTALEFIVAADPVDLALDPTWSQRVARAAINGVGEGQ